MCAFHLSKHSSIEPVPSIAKTMLGSFSGTIAGRVVAGRVVTGRVVAGRVVAVIFIPFSFGGFSANKNCAWMNTITRKRITLRIAAPFNCL